MLRSDFKNNKFNREREAVTEEDSTGLIRSTELIARSTDAIRTYYHYSSDKMGSTTHNVDETGEVQNRYEYDGWGNITVQKEAVPNRFKFTGQQLDPITRQYYLRARFYNPVIARFTQDPKFLPGSQTSIVQNHEEEIMKELLKNVSGAFKQCGYKKRGNSFWKNENGFYRLVHFQTGAFGNYYFINVGLHPLGLPMLTMKPQFIIEHPKEYECILRQRVEHIVDGPKLKRFREGFVWTTDEEMVVNICDSVPDIELWLDKWASYDTIMNSSLEELSGMLSVVPILWQKAYLMLKCYCAHMMGREEEAKELFREYQNEQVEDLEYPLVDQYLGDLLEVDIK